MSRYYHRRLYNQFNQINSLSALPKRFIEIIGLIGLLILIPYIITVYMFFVQNPLFLGFFALVVVAIVGFIFWYIQQEKTSQQEKFQQEKELQYRAIQKFAEVMKLNWRQFEEFVAQILKEKGFHTILGVGIRDGGVDVTAVLGDKKFFVQCKHYGTDNITVEKIRELNGIMNGELIPVGGIFVTTSGFTPDAVSEAHKYGIELWDKNYLIKFLESSSTDIRRKDTGKEVLGVCEKCGGKLILRTAHAGPNAGNNFLGCENFPECHFTKNI